MGHSLSRCFAAGVVASVAFAGPVWAKTRPPSADEIREAAEAFDRGRTAYRAHGYVEAAESFEAADDRAPSSQALLLAMKSRFAAEQVSRALTLAELAIRLYPDDQAAQDEARKLLETHASELGKLNVACSEPCELLLDGKLVHGKADVQRTVYVDPGMHRLRASWENGAAKSLGVKIDAGGFETLTFDSPAASDQAATDAWLAGKPGEEGAPSEAAPGPAEPVRPEEAAPSRNGWSPVVFWSGVGLSGAGVIVSTILGVRAINEPGADRVAAVCGGRTEECPEYQEGVRNQTAASVAIGITAGVSVLTVITGLVLTDWKGKAEAPKSRQAEQASFRPILAVGDGFHMGIEGRF
jgi:hypothetical protein